MSNSLLFFHDLLFWFWFSTYLVEDSDSRNLLFLSHGLISIKYFAAFLLHIILLHKIFITYNIERFVIIDNGWKPLTIIAKHSNLDVAAALDPPLYKSTQLRLQIP